jgi:hypothetical protein
MRISALSILMVSFSCSAVPAWAAGQMKPGLWEMTLKSDAMKNMPKMSPEQIRQMKQMGVNVPEMRGGAMVSKVCITKEMAERDDTAAAGGSEMKDMGCQMKNVRKSAGGYSADYVCTGDTMKGEGRVKGTFAGNEKFSAASEFKGTMGGQPVNSRQETVGRWLAADCGSVKPAPEPAPREK